SHQLEVDLLNVTLYYSDEFYGFDKAYGAAGIGEYYLGLYSLSPENTTFLEKAQKVANYIINNAIITVQNGLKCASWDFGFNEYYTSLSTGVAGVGEFLLDFSQKNHTDTIYNTFARYAGNWLIANMITLGVKDHNGNDIGTGAYWKVSNSSTAVQSYNGYSTGIAGIADFLLKLGLANTVQNSNNRYIDAAIKAGNYLISSYTSSNTPSGAIWDKYMYSWDVNAFSQSKSDLSLEQGTAGIIIFLDNLYLVTHNINYSKAASGAYLYLKTYKTADNPTFYWNVSGHSFILYGNARGQSGIASALLKVYFDSKVAVDAAKDALDYLWSKRVDKGSNRVAFPYSASDSTQYNGLAFGTAGAGMGFLSLYKKTSNIDYFNKAYQCAHFLESSSNWYISVGSTENAYGIETGVAGIGLFFLEMTMTSNDTLYNNTLLSIADYLIGHRKQSGDQSYWDYSNSDTTAYFGWDKGAAGIMYFFTELYKFTANKTYLDVAEGVARWLDSADTSGLWTEYFGGGNTYYGFSRGAAGIGYALLDLYEVTANTTYWNLIDNIKNSLVAQISSMSIPSSPSDSHKYSGIKDGQAGMVKFFSQYYKFTYSSSIKTYLDNFINWFSNNQQSAGNFPYYAGASTYYNDYQKGCAGIIGALMESYEYSINPSSLTIIANIQNYLINHQLSDNSWNDNSDNNVYYGYYYGLAGIADQLMNTPDFQSPSLQVWNFNKSLSSIQYFDSLDVTIKTEDSVSSINNSYLLYSINGSSTWYQITFNSKQDSYYEAIIPQYRYNTHIDFFIVSIDNSGLVSIDSNNLALYSYTVLDLIPPQIIYFKTYDINNTEAKIQYATGGVIRIKVDEPDYASGINYVQIHYDNTKVVGDEITAYMTAVPGMAGLYQIVIPGTNYVYGDPFIYTITIADKQGNINTTGQINTTIGDNKLPNIDYDNLQFGFSTKIPAFTRAEVKVPVYDDNDYQGASGIAEVYLNYTSNNGLTWSKVSLSYSSTEDKYVGAIPGQNLGRIYFMICVVDKAGNIAYFDSRGVKYSDPSEIVTSLYFTYEVTINWVITIIIVAIIAAIILLIFYIYTKKGDYWDRMRRRAEASAKMISIQERFSNAYYATVEWLNKIGTKILSKFQRAPGMPSPIKVWYEEKLGESGRKILSAIGHTFKALFKATFYILVSPFILLAWLVRKTGGLQAFWTALIGLLLIIANVVKYVSEPPYPPKALFFVNLGFILFISAFVLLIFHLLYRIAYK
ncbi:MAG: lanthionine synthetase LanC family protein, partial [Promethearchaeota archaeon]